MGYVNDAKKKKIDENVSTWDKFKSAITPFVDPSEKADRLNDIADENIRRREREKAQQEAIRRRRMQTPGTGSTSE